MLPKCFHRKLLIELDLRIWVVGQWDEVGLMSNESGVKTLTSSLIHSIDSFLKENKVLWYDFTESFFHSRFVSSKSP